MHTRLSNGQLLATELLELIDDADSPFIKIQYYSEGLEVYKITSINLKQNSKAKTDGIVPIVWREIKKLSKNNSSFHPFGLSSGLVFICSDNF